MQIDGRLSQGIRSFFTLLIPLLLYWQDFIIIANEALNSELSSHIVAVPFILGYIIYKLRHVLASSSEQCSMYPLLFNIIRLETAVGVLLCTLGYLLKWYGVYSFYPLEYHIVSLPIFVSGLILIIFNAHTLRTLIFPILFILFIIPPPIELAQRAGAILSILSSQASYRILELLKFPVGFVDQYGSPIISLTRQTGETVFFSVDAACSGLYSLIGLVIFATFSAYISKGKFSRKLIVFFLGFPIIYGLNILRIFLLILIGYYAGVELALNVFHLLGGWVLLFSGTMLILTLADRIFKIKLFEPNIETCTHSLQESDGNYCLQCGKILNIEIKSLTKVEVVKYLAILLVIVYFLSVQVPVFSLTSGHAGVFIKTPSDEETMTAVLPEIEGYDLQFVYKDTEFEKRSGQNASVMYSYTLKNNPYSPVWVGLEISPIKFNMHNWEVCLISYPETQGKTARYEKIDLRDIHLLDNPPLSARFFAFHEKGVNLTQVILYWYTQSEFITENGYETLWTKISVIKYVQSPDYYRFAEDEILPIAQSIVGFWRPISTWSGIGIKIANNGEILIIITGIILSGTILYGVYLIRDNAKKGLIVYNQIHDLKDRTILDIIISSKNRGMNEIEIGSKYKELTEKEINDNNLSMNLRKAEEIGIIKMVIVNINDKPYAVWKTNL